MSGGAEADVSQEQAQPNGAPRTLADPGVVAARCRDLDAWHRAVREAPDLSMMRVERDGRTRTEVRSVLVKAGLWYLRAFMDGPGRSDPGANARPGLDRMARELGVSRRQALAILRAGVAHGYLVQTARGHTESTATYAAALPDERVRDGAPSTPESVREGAPTEPERVRDDPERVRERAREGARRRTPPPHDLRMTSVPQSPATVGPASDSGQAGREEDPAAGLAARLGLVLDDRPRKRAELDDRLGRLLADGWTLGELAAHPAIAEHEPPRTSVVGALCHRLDTLDGTEAPTVAARRRQEEAEARQACRCGGAGVVLDELGDAHPCADCAPAPAGSVAS